jgi:hypothetical protein
VFSDLRTCPRSTALSEQFVFCRVDFAKSSPFLCVPNIRAAASFSASIAEAKLVTLNLRANARVIEYRGQNADHIHPLD